MAENPPPREESKMMIMGPAENATEEPETVVLPNQPRPARDMKGLLRFAMEATAMEDAPSISHFQPMDEEVILHTLYATGSIHYIPCFYVFKTALISSCSLFLFLFPETQVFRRHIKIHDSGFD